MLVGAMVRRLADGVDYDTFRRAWLPDETFADDPRRVLSALNLSDPGEILTVALIDGDPTPERIQEHLARWRPSELRRAERMRGLVGEPSLNAIYRVVGDDVLANPVRA